MAVDHGCDHRQLKGTLELLLKDLRNGPALVDGFECGVECGPDPQRNRVFFRTDAELIADVVLPGARAEAGQTRVREELAGHGRTALSAACASIQKKTLRQLR